MGPCLTTETLPSSSPVGVESSGSRSTDRSRTSYLGYGWGWGDPLRTRSTRTYRGSKRPTEGDKLPSPSPQRFVPVVLINYLCRVGSKPLLYPVTVSGTGSRACTVETQTCTVVGYPSPKTFHSPSSTDSLSVGFWSLTPTYRLLWRSVVISTGISVLIL